VRATTTVTDRDHSVPIFVNPFLFMAVHTLD
jgi:hypothetical protein